ncbi:hypothetical protein EJB05_55969, partial [Eragrostis curvula]
MASPPAVQCAAGRGGASVAVHHRGAPSRRARGHRGARRCRRPYTSAPPATAGAERVHRQRLSLGAAVCDRGGARGNAPGPRPAVARTDDRYLRLLELAFRDIDFGSGALFFHMRGYVAKEGLVFLVPSLSGDGSVYAYVNLFKRDMDVFRDCCYSLMAAGDSRL